MNIHEGQGRGPKGEAEGIDEWKNELNSPELSRLLTGGQQLVKTGVELVLGFT